MNVIFIYVSEKNNSAEGVPNVIKAFFPNEEIVDFIVDKFNTGAIIRNFPFRLSRKDIEEGTFLNIKGFNKAIIKTAYEEIKKINFLSEGDKDLFITVISKSVASYIREYAPLEEGDIVFLLFEIPQTLISDESKISALLKDHLAEIFNSAQTPFTVVAWSNSNVSA